MPRIEVDPTLLAAGAGQQSQLAGRLLELCGHLGQVAGAAASSAGAPEVAAALDDCASGWTTALAALANAVDRQAGNLAAASSAYTGTDAGAMPATR